MSVPGRLSETEHHSSLTISKTLSCGLGVAYAERPEVAKALEPAALISALGVKLTPVCAADASAGERLIRAAP